jgi:hypothetical protein
MPLFPHRLLPHATNHEHFGIPNWRIKKQIDGYYVANTRQPAEE